MVILTAWKVNILCATTATQVKFKVPKDPKFPLLDLRVFTVPNLSYEASKTVEENSFLCCLELCSCEMLLQNDIKKVIISLFLCWEDCHPKADWSNGSWLCAAWQELKVQKSTYRIEKFVTESVRKSLSQAIKPHERPRAPPMGSGPRCLVNLNLPPFVLAPSWTMSWLQSWAAAGRQEEWKGHEEGRRKKTASAALPG